MSMCDVMKMIAAATAVAAIRQCPKLDFSMGRLPTQEHGYFGRARKCVCSLPLSSSTSSRRVFNETEMCRER